jgi:hypothetical protein
MYSILFLVWLVYWTFWVNNWHINTTTSGLITYFSLVGVAFILPYWLHVNLNYISGAMEWIGLWIFLLSLGFCWGCSAMYHILHWSLHTEIKIQKLGKNIIQSIIFSRESFVFWTQTMPVFAYVSLDRQFHFSFFFLIKPYYTLVFHFYLQQFCFVHSVFGRYITNLMEWEWQ